MLTCNSPWFGSLSKPTYEPTVGWIANLIIHHLDDFYNDIANTTCTS